MVTGIIYRESIHLTHIIRVDLFCSFFFSTGGLTDNSKKKLKAEVLCVAHTKISGAGQKVVSFNLDTPKAVAVQLNGNLLGMKVDAK